MAAKQNQLQMARWLMAMNPGGRARRRLFWIVMAMLWAVFAILLIFLETTFGRMSTYVLYPLVFWVSVVMMSKRFHDRDKSAWNMLALIIPVIGPLWVFLELGLRGGSPSDNRFGPDPRFVDLDYLKLD